MKKNLSLFSLLVTAITGICQPQTPQFPTIQPTQGLPYAPNNTNYYQPQTSQVRVANAKDVLTKQNNQAVHNAISDKNREVEQLMRDIQEIKNKSEKTTVLRQYAPNPERTKDFPAALKRLQDMLSGKLPLSEGKKHKSNITVTEGNPTEIKTK